MNPHESPSIGHNSDSVRVGEWVRHWTYSGQEYYYNVKSFTSQLEKPREWLEYEEQHGLVRMPILFSSSSTTSKASSSSSFSHHYHHQQKTHQGQASSSSSTNDMRSNTISSETAEELLQQGCSSRNPISDLYLSDSLSSSPSYRHSDTGDLGNQPSEDLNSEDMDISVSSIKNVNSSTPMCKRKHSMDSQQSSSKRPNSATNLPKNQGSDNKDDENTVPERQQQEWKLLEEKRILEKTFSYMDDDFLTLEPREAAKLWNISGAEEDLVAKYFVGFSWDFEGRRETRKKSNDNSINELEAFLSSSSFKPSKVPVIPKITIGDPRDVKLWESLGVLEKVTSLKLIIIHFDLEFFTSLIQLLPNLKYLYLPEYSKTQSIKSHTLEVLTSVNSSVWASRGPLVLPSITLIPKAVNLLNQTEKLADCRKIVVEEARLGLSYKLTGTKLFEEIKPRVAHIMGKFLSNSQNTLTILHLSSCEMYLHLLHFPCLPGVTHMEWNFYRDGGFRQPDYGFSPSLQPSEKFPNLHSIFIRYNCIISRRTSWRERGDGPGANFFVTLFKNMGGSPSVKNVGYFDSYRDFTIDPLFQVFPNVEHFKAMTPEFYASRDSYWALDPSSESNFHSVLTFGKNLKELDISVDLDGHGHGLDSFFTGFSEKTVEMMMRKHPEWPSYTCEEMEQLRFKPSILKLTELQTLTINLQGRPSWRSRPLIVAGEYAFKYMPKDVRIVIKVEHPPELLLARLEEVSKLPNVVIDIEDSL